MHNKSIRLHNTIKRKKIIERVACAIIGAAITLLIMAMLGYFDVYEDTKVNQKEITENIKIINDKSKIYNEVKNDKDKVVEGFSLEKDTVPFGNFGSVYSHGGNCAGIALLELFAFTNRIDRDIKIDGKILGPLKAPLGNYILSDKEKNTLAKILKNTYNEDILFDLSYNDKQEIKFDYSKYLENKELAEVYNYITYYQVNQNNFQKEYVYSDKLLNKKNKSITEFDIKKDILNKIDNNEPVGIGITGNILGGHAVLAYGYKIIDENTIKIYVADSNRPILADPKTDADKTYNEEVRGINILFLRKGNIWNYAFNPNVKTQKEVDQDADGYYYNGEFNSYLKGATLCIY